MLKPSRSKAGFDENEWLENNQSTANSKNSKPTVFDPRFFDLLVELTDKIEQQKVEMTNQHKEFNQNQRKWKQKCNIWLKNKIRKWKQKFNK